MWCINVVVFFLGYRYTALFHHVQYSKNGINSNIYEIKWAKLKLNITKHPPWTYCRLSLPHSLLSLLTSSIWPANAIFCFTVPLSEKACALENGGSWPLFGMSTTWYVNELWLLCADSEEWRWLVNEKLQDNSLWLRPVVRSPTSAQRTLQNQLNTACSKLLTDLG